MAVAVTSPLGWEGWSGWSDWRAAQPLTAMAASRTAVAMARVRAMVLSSLESWR
jgi:hypothetical protein